MKRVGEQKVSASPQKTLDLRLELLRWTLEAGVPIEISNLRRRLQQEGREIDNELIDQARERMQVFQKPGKSEALTFPVERLTKEMVVVLIESMAILAHHAGGITAFGCHFEVRQENTLQE